eukprot:9500856-Pyramimonas_sp.AAC.1
MHLQRLGIRRGAYIGKEVLARHSFDSHRSRLVTTGEMDFFKVIGSPCMALRSIWTTDWAYDCDPSSVVVDALGGDKHHAVPPSRTVSTPPRDFAPPEKYVSIGNTVTWIVTGLVVGLAQMVKFKFTASIPMAHINSLGYISLTHTSTLIPQRTITSIRGCAFCSPTANRISPCRRLNPPTARKS